MKRPQMPPDPQTILFVADLDSGDRGKAISLLGNTATG